MKIKNPFPGLRAFSANESHLFFGRHNHIKQVSEKLSKYRFVSIVGNSGSGKSSLVKAGILPHLQQNDENLMVAVFRPGNEPIYSLCKAIYKTCLNNLDFDEREPMVILKKSHLGLIQLVRTLMPKEKKILILVDQFEELFRYRETVASASLEDQSEQFVSLLLSAAEQKEVSIYVMMTIRSDFLGDCEQFAGLPEAINDGQFLIPRMNKEELQMCITGPVELADGKISPRLVQALINEVARNPDQLPVLQHALMRTWDVWLPEKESGKPIDIEHYLKTGTIKNALSNHAEEAFNELGSDENKKLAEKIFKSITVKGPDNRGIRRPTPIYKLIEITETDLRKIIEIVDVFRVKKRGFIMPDETVTINEFTVLDISHESLMRVWQRLKTWVDEEAETADLYKRITESALLYQQGKTGLWRDPDLQLAVEWIEKQQPNKAWSQQYNSEFGTVMKFIEASVDNKKFLLLEKKRRRNLIRTVLAFFIVALSILSLWAFNERNNAKNKAIEALNEKQKAEEQSELAKQMAIQAKNEKNKADEQKLEAEKQRKFAIIKAEEAKLQKLKAEQASLAATQARKRAELDKQIAILQKQISDSLKTIAETSTANAYRLRLLSIAQNMAIKSVQAIKGTYSDDVKELLALQAYKFNETYKGKTFDTDILNALMHAYKYHFADKLTLKYHDGSVLGVATTKNGMFATCSDDGQIVLNNLNNLPKYIKLPKQPHILRNIEFNENGDKLICTADQLHLLVFDVAMPLVQPKVIKTNTQALINNCLVLGNKIITTHLDGTVLIIDENSFKIISTVKLNGIAGCVIPYSEQSLLFGMENGRFVFYDLITNKFEELNKHTNDKINSITLANHHKLIAAGCSNGKIYIYKISQKLNNGNLLAEPKLYDEMVLNAHTAAVTKLTTCGNDNLIASASLDAAIKIWHTDYLQDAPLILKDHENWIFSMAYSNTGHTIISGSRDKTVKLNILNTNDVVKAIEDKTKRNFTLAEWLYFVGNDVPFEKTITYLP
ncbi:MAG: hypothetical protein ACK4K9_01850 [Bacteroidia bacterium]